MFRPPFVRLLWRVEGIRKQEKTFNQLRLGRSQHGRLSPSVRMTAEEDPARSQPSHRGNGRTQSFLIAFRIAAGRWSMRPELSEGEIAAKHRHSRATERVSQRYQQRRLAIRSGTVRQNQVVPAGIQ
jgi:hypothetical protein